MSLILTLLAALAAIWAHGVLPAPPRPGFRIALRALAAGSLATAAALALASRNTLAPARPLLLGLGAAVALVAWAGLIRLVSFETRRRDLVGRWLCLGLAGLGVLLGWPSMVTASLAASGTWAWRWKQHLETRARFTLGLIALALGLTLSTHLGHVFPPGVLSGAPETFHRFARTVLITSTFYALFGAVALLRAWVSDPSLGIRAVSRRLALSHVLVGLVPVLLIVTLWTVTTVLGVLNERAIVGARAVAALGRAYHAQLSAALRRPSESSARLAALPAALDSAAGIRVWYRPAAVRGRIAGSSGTLGRLAGSNGTLGRLAGSNGTLDRLAGSPVAGEARLSRWLDSLATLPDQGIVSLGDSVFVGAAALGPGGGAVLLVPMAPVLGSLPDSVARARLSIWKTALIQRRGPGAYAFGGEDSLDADDRDAAARDSAAAARDSEAAADSARVAGVRRSLRRLGLPDSSVTLDTRPQRPGVHVSVGGRSVDMRDGVDNFLIQGHALADGIDWGDGSWRASQYMLTARAAPREILSGLASDLGTNRLGILPLVIVGLFALAALLVLAMSLAIVRGMGRSITQAVGALEGAASRLSRGDLSHRIAIAGDDDLWRVAAAFNTATEGLVRAREAEQEQQRIEDELEVARRIQARLLPAVVPHITGLEIAGHYDPAREVGGDYYDHIALDDHRVLLVIADVSGKSVPAALIMAGFRAALVSQDLSTCDPPALAERLNGFLSDSLDPGKFVTAFLAVMDGANGRLVYVNAGHNPPVLLRAGGHHEMLEAGGTILGIMPASRYGRGEVELAPGDVLLLYTDGVTEATSPTSELWGDPRLIATLRACAAQPCNELVKSIVREIRAFEGEAGSADDVTLIAVRRTSG